MPAPKKDLTDQIFGRWRVLREAGRANKQVLWECECSCGNRRDIRGGTLRQGLSLSCGECLDHSALHTTHGRSREPLYQIWLQMLRRRETPTSKDYRHYGGRGIMVCPRWHDVANFVADMGHRPPGGTLERVDVDGDYEPPNCRWATQKEQTRNARSNINITYDGRTQCIGAWAEELGMNYGTLYARLVTKNWPVERALRSPTNA